MTPSTITSDPFKRYLAGFLGIFAAMAALGFALIVLASYSIDVSADIEKALSGWRLRLTSSLVLLVGFVCFVAGIISSVAIYYERTKVLYIVTIILIPLLLGMVVIGIFSLLGVRKVKREAIDKTTDAFMRINDSIKIRDAIFRLQMEKECCGIDGPSFYSFFVNPSENATDHFVPSSCCVGLAKNSAAESLFQDENSTKTTPKTPPGAKRMSWTIRDLDYCQSRFAFDVGCAEIVKKHMKKAYAYMGGLTLLCAFFLLVIVALDWFLIGHYRKLLKRFLGSL